jgi:hypothetical protein
MNLEMGGLSRERRTALAGGQAAERRESQIEVGLARLRPEGFEAWRSWSESPIRP